MEGYRGDGVRRATSRHLRDHHGNRDVITFEHMQAMKDESIVRNIGHFDNEIQVAKPEAHCRWEEISPGGPHHLPDGKEDHPAGQGPLRNSSCATGHPSFVMSNSFANQTLAQIELYTRPDAYEAGASTCRPRSSTRRWRACT